MTRLAFAIPVIASLVLASACASSDDVGAEADGSAPLDAGVDAGDDAAPGPLGRTPGRTGTEGDEELAFDGGRSADAAPLIFPLESACTMNAERTCDLLERCAPHRLATDFGARKACVARKRQVCLEEGRAPGSGQTVGTLVRCAKDLEDASCSDFFARREPEACFPVGARSAGSPCGADVQCATGYCKRTSACGLCSPRASLGMACDRDEACSPEQICAPSTRTCVKPGDKGAKCRPDAPCGFGLACLGGMCSPPRALDAACSDDAECDVARGHLCQPAVMGAGRTCQLVRVSATGERCGLVEGMQRVCAYSASLCRSTGNEAICQAPARDGEACTNDRPCAAPSLCILGRCLPAATSTCGS